MHLQDNDRLDPADGMLLLLEQISSEQDVFELLGMKYLPPAERNI